VTTVKCGATAHISSEQETKKPGFKVTFPLSFIKQVIGVLCNLMKFLIEIFSWNK
jgi:hypothetical protein